MENVQGCAWGLDPYTEAAKIRETEHLLASHGEAGRAGHIAA